MALPTLVYLDFDLVNHPRTERDAIAMLVEAWILRSLIQPVWISTYGPNTARTFRGDLDTKAWPVVGVGMFDTPKRRYLAVREHTRYWGDPSEAVDYAMLDPSLAWDANVMVFANERDNRHRLYGPALEHGLQAQYVKDLLRWLDPHGQYGN